MTPIAICRKRLNPFFIAVAPLMLALALAACGGDDEEPASTTKSPPASQPTEAPRVETGETQPGTGRSQTEQAPTETSPSPEDQPGGAGDEEAARTLALFTARNGRITPAVIHVPAFISVRIELRSGDGGDYALTFAGRRLAVSGGLASVATTIAGLRPGERLVGTPSGASGRVRIEATAEPGP
jgi:hypothetical protein